jgi:hypothetical protein
MKLDANEFAELTGRTPTAKTSDTQLLVSALDRLVKSLSAQDEPVVHVSPVVNIEVPKQQPVAWRFEVERDNAGFIRAINASPSNGHV